MGWIDVHAHLNMLETSPAETLEAAKAAGVEKVITIGTEPGDHDFVFNTARDFYPDIYCTLGVHPHEAEKWSESVEATIRERASEKYVVGIGEIGLDYYYDNSPREIQREVFEKQLQISLDVDLPFQIHTRDAEEDTVAALSKFKGLKGLIHCFTGTEWLARQCLDLGFNISFSGIVTFKNADALRDVVRLVPIERLHVETDSPFLTPVPHRGRKNAPDKVVHTAELVASLKGVSVEDLCKQTQQNALAMFPKISW